MLAKKIFSILVICLVAGGLFSVSFFSGKDLAGHLAAIFKQDKITDSRSSIELPPQIAVSKLDVSGGVANEETEIIKNEQPASISNIGNRVVTVTTVQAVQASDPQANDGSVLSGPAFADLASLESRLLVQIENIKQQIQNENKTYSNNVFYNFAPTQKIDSLSNISLSGSFSINGFSWPSASGSDGQVLALSGNSFIWKTIASGSGESAVSQDGDYYYVAISEDEYFGIGTSSPVAKLDVYGNLILSGPNRYLNFYEISGVNGYGFRDNSGTLQYKNSGGDWANIGSGGGGSGTVSAGTTGQFPYYAGDGTSLTATSSIFISTAGKIGIGTTSPTEKLNIIGNLLLEGTIVESEQNTLDESFEGSFPSAGWLNGSEVVEGYASFVQDDDVAYDGSKSATYALQPEDIAAGMSYSVALDSAATLSFYWKVSCHPTDEVFVFQYDSEDPILINGETDWAQVTIELAAGEHTFIWAFGRTGSGTAGSDQAWFDKVVISQTVSNTTGGWVFSRGLSLGTTTTSYVLTVTATSSLRDVIPETDSLYSLGSSANRWKDAWIDTAHITNWSGNLTLKPEFSLTSSTSIATGPNKVFTYGQYAYITDDTPSILIYDISDPVSSVLTGTISLPSTAAVKIKFSDKYAYVICGEDFLVYDISNPASALLLDSYSLAETGTESFTSLEVSGGYAYVGTHTTDTGTAEKNIRIFDITDPRAIVEAADLVLAGAEKTALNDLHRSGNYLYAAEEPDAGYSSEGRLRTISILDPLNPKDIVATVLSGTPDPVALAGWGDYIYILTDSSSDGVYIYNISNPESPVFACKFADSLGGGPSSFVLSGKYLYRTGGEYVYAYDVSSSTVLSLVDTYTFSTDSSSDVDSISLSGGYLYAIDNLLDKLVVLGLTKIDAHSGEIGSLKAGMLEVDNDLNIFGKLSAEGELRVGAGGIFSAGPLWVTATGTSVFMGDVTIGSSTEQSLLRINGDSPKIYLSDFSAGANQKHWYAQSSDGYLKFGTSRDNFAGIQGASGIYWTESDIVLNALDGWRDIASDGDGSNLIASSGDHLYISTDSGVNWNESQPAGNVDGDYWEFVASDSDGSYLAAYYTNTGSGTFTFYTSSSSGATWYETKPGGMNGNWRDVAIDNDGSNLIAANYGGGLFISTDGGGSWTETQPSGEGNLFWFATASNSSGSTLVAAVSHGRMYITTNGGSNWTETQPAGAADKYWVGIACDDDCSTILAISYNAADEGNVYLSTDTGGTWEELILDNSLDEKQWSGVAVDSDGSTLAAADKNGDLFMSVDSGVTWKNQYPAAGDGVSGLQWWGVAMDDFGTKFFVEGVGSDTGQMYLGALADTVRLTISNSGYVGIGTSTPSRALDISRSMGNAIAAGWDVWSSEKYKTDINYLNEEQYQDVLDKISVIQIATYYYDQENCVDSSCKKRLGLIAENAPEEVRSGAGDSVSLYDLSSFTLAGVKELNRQLQELRAQIDLEKMSSSTDIDNMEGLGDISLKETDSGNTLSSVLDGLESAGISLKENLVRAKIFMSQIFKARTIIIESEQKDGQDPTIGSALISAGEQEIYVPNNQVEENSKIFISPEGDRAVSFTVCEKKTGEGFKICLEEAAENGIGFSWWIVQSSSGSDSDLYLKLQ